MENVGSHFEKIAKDWEESSREKAVNDPREVTVFKDIKYTTTRSLSPALPLLERFRVLSVEEKSEGTTAYEFLRTQVLSRMNKKGWSILAVTSPNKGEGKTLTAINLAISISRKIDNTVLLVDANLKNPEVSSYFGLDEDAGLVDYILNDYPVEKSFIHPQIDRLTLLPSGTPIKMGIELLTSPKMLALVKELKSRYRSRIIIFDLPPVLSSADTLAFSPYVDCVLLVVKAGETKKEALEQSLEFLENVPIIGTVLNQG